MTDFDIAGAAWDSIKPDDLFRIDDKPTPAHAQHSPVDLRDRYEMLPRAQIERWQANPRGLVDYEDVPQLRDDILSNRASGGGLNGSGVEVPLIVRPHPSIENKYILMDGERRWMATEGTVIDELPCLVRHVSEEQAMELAIRVDLHGEEWTPIQAGKALLAYMNGANHFNAPRSEAQTAKDFGVSKGFIANRVRAAKASPELQAMVEQRPDSMSHVEYLEKVENPRKQRELIRQVLSGAPVTQIRQQVNEITKKPAPAPVEPALPPRPAFDGYDYSPPLPSSNGTRTVVLGEPAPDYTAMAQQAAQLWQAVAESAEYSDVSEAVKSTLAAIAKLKKRA